MTGVACPAGDCRFEVKLGWPATEPSRIDPLSTQMPNDATDNQEVVSNRDVVARDMRLRAEEIRTQRLIDDVKYWRDRADEVRTEAEFTLQPITRTALLETAQGYEALASRIEQRLGEAGLPKSS